MRTILLSHLVLLAPIYPLLQCLSLLHVYRRLYLILGWGIPGWGLPERLHRRCYLHVSTLSRVTGICHILLIGAVCTLSMMGSIGGRLRLLSGIGLFLVIGRGLIPPPSVSAPRPDPARSSFFHFFSYHLRYSSSWSSEFLFRRSMLEHG